ncbi:uncharacterized protein METZ01_LOCUS379288 [marine metagenome]|uniref:Uncharacterized protein n=1 Tax=marine metagenome TaxID=408172 RepID=A0A382TWJ0_9ZZZZ
MKRLLLSLILLTPILFLGIIIVLIFMGHIVVIPKW